MRAERRDAEDLRMALDLVQDLLEETRRVRQQRTDSLLADVRNGFIELDEEDNGDGHCAK